MIQIVSIITIEQTEDEREAIQAVREAIANVNMGVDNLIVLTTTNGRDDVGALATRTLEGMAQELDRALVIRCDDQFRVGITDYPRGGGRPYDLNLNVSEIVGIYNDTLK